MAINDLRLIFRGTQSSLIGDYFTHTQRKEDNYNNEMLHLSLYLTGHIFAFEGQERRNRAWAISGERLENPYSLRTGNHARHTLGAAFTSCSDYRLIRARGAFGGTSRRCHSHTQTPEVDWYDSLRHSRHQRRRGWWRGEVQGCLLAEDKSIYVHSRNCHK